MWRKEDQAERLSMLKQELLLLLPVDLIRMLVEFVDHRQLRIVCTAGRTGRITVIDFDPIHGRYQTSLLPPPIRVVRSLDYEEDTGDLYWTGYNPYPRNDGFHRLSLASSSWMIESKETVSHSNVAPSDTACAGAEHAGAHSNDTCNTSILQHLDLNNNMTIAWITQFVHLGEYLYFTRKTSAIERLHIGTGQHEIFMKFRKPHEIVIRGMAAWKSYLIIIGGYQSDAQTAHRFCTCLSFDTAGCVQRNAQSIQTRHAAVNHPRTKQQRLSLTKKEPIKGDNILELPNVPGRYNMPDSYPTRVVQDTLFVMCRSPTHPLGQQLFALTLTEVNATSTGHTSIKLPRPTWRLMPSFYHPPSSQSPPLVTDAVLLTSIGRRLFAVSMSKHSQDNLSWDQPPSIVSCIQTLDISKETEWRPVQPF
jgi:hypothetical protein